MTDKTKETIGKYSLWIAAVMMLIAVGGQIGTCSGGVYSAGKAIESKASAAKVQQMEVEFAAVRECVGNIKLRQNRMDHKLDKMDRKLDRLLLRKSK